MTTPQPVPLDQIDADRLEALLVEETAGYAEWYRWDFHPTAQLVRKLADTHSLGGVALLVGGEVAGYSYFVIEDNKALIGDAYIRDEWASASSERLLMAATLEQIREHPQVRRLEGQPMMLRYPYSHPKLERFERLFLELDLVDTRWPSALQLPHGYWLEAWNWRIEDEAARLLYRAYRGHVDAEINDQYCAPGSARTYLSNMIRYPACGEFNAAASFVVTEKAGGRAVGLVLSSVSAAVGPAVGPAVGHVAQLCVEPEARGLGLGKVLMWASLAKFTELGCECSTLTVTAANQSAVRLYESLGYAERRRVAAYVGAVWPF